MKYAVIRILIVGMCWCFEVRDNLSEYNIYMGDSSNLIPSEKFIPYELITPLFTDYALKHRMIYIPEGKKIIYNDSTVFDFPIGTIIVKTFYYPMNFDNPTSTIDLVETRLLVHEDLGWKAYPYIWDEDDVEASLSLVGGKKIVTWKKNNKKHKINYFIPNVNQCKTCHLNNQVMIPIGPSARQLNSNLEYSNGDIKNQLVKWYELGVLDSLPNLADTPKIAKWNNPHSGSIDERARAWLDINCAHCHNTGGPASNTGLYLDIYQTNSKALGIFKKPVAAGRGSGGLKYDIVPGKPKQSILIYRYNSTDPAIMMPELGRTLIHEEALELISDWIEELDDN